MPTQGPRLLRNDDGPYRIPTVARGLTRRVSLAQRVACEGLGTAFLLATVIGSGVMAFKLAQGNGAIALLCNTIPTGAILTVLILAFGPVSGAHFNPAVTIAFALRRELSWQVTVLYITVQVIGAISGVWAAHVMFELPVWAVDAYPPGELLLRNPTTRHRRLLRARSERPPDDRAAGTRDELAPPHALPLVRASHPTTPS
ncbi:MAG: aquaporin [Xanthobacteraceae bacterium]